MDLTEAIKKEIEKQKKLHLLESQKKSIEGQIGKLYEDDSEEFKPSFAYESFSKELEDVLKSISDAFLKIGPMNTKQEHFIKSSVVQGSSEEKKAQQILDSLTKAEDILGKIRKGFIGFGIKAA